MKDRIVAGMRCSQVLGVLSEYVDGELDAAAIHDVEQSAMPEGHEQEASPRTWGSLRLVVLTAVAVSLVALFYANHGYEDFDPEAIWSPTEAFLLSCLGAVGTAVVSFVLARFVARDPPLPPRHGAGGRPLHFGDDLARPQGEDMARASPHCDVAVGGGRTVDRRVGCRDRRRRNLDDA